MTAYLIKLFVLLPVMGAFIFGALWLYRKYQPALAQVRGERELKVLDTLPMGNLAKLAVVQFEDRKILISVSRSGIEKITESKP